MYTKQNVVLSLKNNLRERLCQDVNDTKVIAAIIMFYDLPMVEGADPDWCIPNDEIENSSHFLLNKTIAFENKQPKRNLPNNTIGNILGKDLDKSYLLLLEMPLHIDLYGT